MLEAKKNGEDLGLNARSDTCEPSEVGNLLISLGCHSHYKG